MQNREGEKGNRIEALRMRAEKLLHNLNSDNASATPDMYPMKELMHELLVQQVELEIQNEELLESRVVIEKSLHDYAMLYEFAPVAYFTLDRYGVILKANVAAGSLVGHSNKKLINKLFRSLLVSSQASAFYDFMDQVCSSDTKQTGTFEISTKAENILTVHIEAQCISYQQDQTGCLMAVIDLTSQKEAENKLQREKVFSENLLEHSIDGIVAFDNQSRIIAWNKTMQALTGKFKEEVLGRNIFDLFPAYQVNDEGKAVSKALQGEASVLHDHPYGIKNGFYEVYTLPLTALEPTTEKQVVTGGLSIIHDVTERIKLEQERLTLKLQGQKELLNVILQAQEEERKRISESLHNGVGQILYAALLSLQKMSFSQTPLPITDLESIRKQTENLLKEAIRDLRHASHELVPVSLEEFGLQVAINDFCNRFSHSGIELSCIGFEQRLEKQLELAIYRITQELVNNIAKHSGATRARIEMFKERGQLVIEAQDNGKGIDTNASHKKGIGLKTIKDRVKLLGGTMKIESSPNKGTLITLMLPFIP